MLKIEINFINKFIHNYNSCFGLTLFSLLELPSTKHPESPFLNARSTHK